jgi:glycosyltransferase involved in cell wall biosynthesis
MNGYAEVGSLSRVLNAYRKFASDGWNVTFFTSERTNKDVNLDFDARIVPQLPYNLPKRFNAGYQTIMPILHLGMGKKIDLIITDQAYAGFPAPLAGKLWGAKVIARCGMVYGEAVETLKKGGKSTRKKIRTEKYVFNNADICMLPTRELADWVHTNYNIPQARLAVVPNYVDIDLFKPDCNSEQDIDIICIGRLVEKKRHDLLIESLAGTGYNVTIIGHGKLQGRLRDIAKEKGVNLTLTTRIENNQMPSYLNRSKIYINVASWEGHPKALIEAMSCGCACIAADSPGLKNQMSDGHNGLLVNPDPVEITVAIDRLVNNADLRKQLGENARTHAVQNFSLNAAFEQYKEIADSLLA